MNHLKPRAANSPPLTPISFLDRAATVYGECTSVVYNDTVYTWSQTHRRCLQIASSLSSNGIKRGHVVSVLAPNIPASYELHFAVPMSGAILNNINTRLDPRAVSVILHHSESKLVFVDCLCLSLLSQALSLLPKTYKKPLVVIIEDEIKKINENEKSGILATYEEMVEKGDPQIKWVRPESEWDPIVLNYTSGTTSSPKGVVHCHRSSFMTSIVALVDWALPIRAVYLWTLPMFHGNGWGYTWANAAVGATNVCLRKFDAPTIYTLITRHKVTHMCGAPVVLKMLSNHPNPSPLTRPIEILTGGAPPPAAVLLRIESLGFSISHGYGLTETGGISVSCAWKPDWNKFPATDRARLKGRQGVRTIGTTDVDVIDERTGNPVNQDGKSVGEIVLRGGSLMLGYLKDPEATSKCMGIDGWFRTGDVGVIHPDGYLEIKDRSKDIIISGGENINTVEVESVLYTIPGVNEVAVVARPDEYWGETPCAFLTRLKDGKSVTESEVIEYCRGRLPNYMVPKTVVFMDELPMTSTGKIQKFVLRDMAKAMGSSSPTKTTSRL